MAATLPLADCADGDDPPLDDSGGNPAVLGPSPIDGEVCRFSGHAPASSMLGFQASPTNVNMDDMMKVLIGFQSQIHALMAVSQSSHFRISPSPQPPAFVLDNPAAVNSSSGQSRAVLQVCSGILSSPMAAMAESLPNPSKNPTKTLIPPSAAGVLPSAGAGNPSPATTGPPPNVQAAATLVAANPKPLAATLSNTNPNPQTFPLNPNATFSHNTLNEIPISLHPNLSNSQIPFITPQSQTLISQIPNLGIPNPQSINPNSQSQTLIPQIPNSQSPIPNSQFQTLIPQIDIPILSIPNPNSQIETLISQSDFPSSIGNPNPQSKTLPSHLNTSQAPNHQIEQSNPQLNTSSTRIDTSTLQNDFPPLVVSKKGNLSNFGNPAKKGNFSQNLPPPKTLNPNLPDTSQIPQKPKNDIPRPPKSFIDVLAKENTPKPSIPFRTGGTYKGKPAIKFTAEEVEIMAAPFKLSLIGKFSYGRPNMEDIRKFFTALGLKGESQISLLDPRHILIRLRLEEDYTRLWVRQTWRVQGFTMRLFKWSPTFRCSEESPVVPVWISLPFLPVHLVHCKEALFSIAAKVGKPLRTDHATALLNRPNVARVLVEFDVSQEFVDKIWIEEGDEGFWQDVIFETEPKYCLSCKHLGHRQDECHITNPGLRGLNKTTKENAKPGDESAKSANVRAPLGVPQYVPVSKPFVSTQGPVPPVTFDIAPDPVPTTLLSASHPVTLGNSTSPPGTSGFPPISSSTVVTVCAGSLPAPVPVIPLPPASTCAPAPALTSTTFSSGVSTLSAGAPDFVPQPPPGILTASVTPVVAALASSSSVPLLHSYSPPPFPARTTVLPLPASYIFPVGHNYQSESVPSNQSFEAGRIGASHSARSASSDDESGGENLGSYFHGKFPSEDEQLHDDDCTREVIEQMREAHSGSSSAATLADKSLDDDGFPLPKRSERLQKKKAQGLVIGSSSPVSGRRRRR